MEFNNREIAAATWIAAVTAAMLLKPEIRSSLASLAGAFFQKTIIISVALAAIWVFLCVWSLSEVGLWEVGNLKTTIVWGVTFAFVTMMDMAKVSDDRTYFRSTVRDIISMTIVVTFIAEAYSFSLLVELITLPIITTIAMMQVIASREEKHARVHSLCTWLLTLSGSIYIGNGIFSATGNLDEFISFENLLEFVVPVILSLLFLPFIFLMGAFVTYERAFIGLRSAIKKNSLMRYAKIKAILGFGLNLESLRRWVREVQLRHPASRAEIDKAILNIKRMRKIEKDPPAIDPGDGWSPYVATEFLCDIGLETQDYHQSYENQWAASSNMRDLGCGLFPDNLAYYIEGDETCAKLLKLKLNVNNIETATESESLFRGACYNLLSKALGEASMEIYESIENLENFSIVINRYKLSLIFDDFIGGVRKGYSRKLIIEHLGATSPLPGGSYAGAVRVN